MSVTTTASEKLDSAKDHIKEAIRNLSEIVINECYGSDDFEQCRLDTLADVMKELLEIKKRL